MKVLHVINTLSAGGAEVFVADLAIALSKDCEVHVWTYSGVCDEKGQHLCELMQRAGIEVVSAGIMTKVRMLSIPALLRAYINKYQPDVVHSHLEQSQLFVALSMCLFRSRPILVRTIHSVHFCLPLARRLRRWLNTQYDWNVACSSTALKAPENLLPKSRSSAIDNGIALPRLENRELARQAVRAELGVASHQKMFVQVGGMRGEPMPKAHDVVIEAFAAGGFSSDSQLVFLGDGPRRAGIEARAKELGIHSSIHFCGVVREVVRYILAADVVLMPSRYEGLPLAAAEAVCVGAPMVLSSIEALGLFASKATSVCEPADVSSLIASMTYTLDHSAEMWHEGERLMPAFREQFDIVGVAKRYFDLYSSLAANATTRMRRSFAAEGRFRSGEKFPREST